MENQNNNQNNPNQNGGGSDNGICWYANLAPFERARPRQVIKEYFPALLLHQMNVAQESFLLARSWLHPGAKKYLVYGFGMGYVIRSLLELLPEDAVVVVWLIFRFIASRFFW